MIAYYYPPLGGIGALRPLHFSRYLGEFGWNTTVLTVLNDPTYLQDPSLARFIPEGQRIHRAYRLPIFATIRRLARWKLRKKPLLYSFMDPQFDWVPAAVRKGRRAINESSFDAIYATAPPFSTLRVARNLKKYSNLPVVADLRDQFVTNDSIVWPTTCHKKFYALYERNLLLAMDRIIIANQIYSEDIARIHGELSLEPEWIPNGYDPEDFAEEHAEPPENTFVMGYFGSTYGIISSRPFFRSLAMALRMKPDMRDRLKLIFMGRMDERAIRQEASKAGVTHELELLDFRPHREAVSMMRRCHVLILFSGMVIRSIPGKVYEYAAAERPILSFETPGFYRGFITRNNFGYSVNGHNLQEGALKIVQLYDTFRHGGKIKGPSLKDYEPYCRRRLAGKLATVLDSLLTQST